jgi:hypothetical protein
MLDAAVGLGNRVIPDKLLYVSAFPVLEADGIRGLLALLRQEVSAFKATLLVLDGLVAAEKAGSFGHGIQEVHP